MEFIQNIPRDFWLIVFPIAAGLLIQIWWTHIHSEEIEKREHYATIRQYLELFKDCLTSVEENIKILNTDLLLIESDQVSANHLKKFDYMHFPQKIKNDFLE